MKVKIYGAGSIGNHLSHGCRSKGWDVLMCDTDPEALQRTQRDIYPGRYGAWDDQIRLYTVDDVPEEDFDVVIIGTPPNTHMELALSELNRATPPRAILIEKPACTPSLEGAQEVVDRAIEKSVRIAVGYNHALTEHTKRAGELFAKGIIGNAITISAGFREYWGGIFAAHPWLNGPHESYLGYYQKGGGACGEHSHAINIWLHFAGLVGLGRIVEVSARMDMIEDGKGSEYDRIALMNVATDKNYIGSIIQDVVTEPPQKVARIQGEKGYLEWQVNRSSGEDSVTYSNQMGDPVEEVFPKSRPMDFQGELDHLEAIIANDESSLKDSPISMEKGFDTMMVIAAAYLSHKKKRTVSIDYSKGYSLSALSVV